MHHHKSRPIRGPLLLVAAISAAGWGTASNQVDQATHLGQLVARAHEALLAGNVTAARSRFEEVLALQPRHGPALLGLAAVHESVEEYLDALSLARLAAAQEAIAQAMQAEDDTSGNDEAGPVANAMEAGP